MSGIERCPHCFAPLAGMTNGFGGVYLQCMDCGYYEGVTRQADPFPSPTREKVLADGTVATYKRKFDIANPGAVGKSSRQHFTITRRRRAS